MRSAYILLFIMILVTGNVLSCGSQVSRTSENITAVNWLTTHITEGTTPTITESANSSPGRTSTPTALIPETATANTDASSHDDFKVVGYITHWHLNRLSSIDLGGITHLIWQGVEVTNSGDPTLRVANNAGWWQIRDVVMAGHYYGAKVLVSLIGHWNESAINTIWRAEKNRKQLIENLVGLVKTYNLDGIDVDNENKGWDRDLYSAFIKELYDELSPLGKIISVAGSPYRVCLTPDVYPLVDFVNLMTYDMGAPDHSTFEDSLQAVELWVDEEVPKEKLLIGVPFYGRDGDDSFYEYWWIIENYSPAPDQNEVSEPDAYGGIIWWNGQDLAKEKVLYMKDNGFGGIMLYELGQDSPDEFSLLQAVYDVLEIPAEPVVTGIPTKTRPAP